MRKVALNLGVSLAALTAVIAAPALAQTVAITNARILTAGPAGEIANGTIVLQGGKIASLGAGGSIPAGASIVDAKGGTVTPGFVAANTLLGAVEVRSLGDDLTVNNPD